MKISEATRRDIFDSFIIDNIPWSGRLEEPDFLARLFDLKSLPTTDIRFKDAHAVTFRKGVTPWPPFRRLV
jgi:hypothetical protein